MSEPKFSYRITQSNPVFDSPLAYTVYVDGHPEHTGFAMTKWGARMACKRYVRRWRQRTPRQVIEERGDL